MRIYVTGASGFIGAHVVDRLRREGHAVVALGRDAARVPPQDGVEFRQLDLLDLDRVLPAIEDCDAGIHAAGAGPGSDAKTMQDANVQASRHLAASCRRKNHLHRLVAFSSAAIEEVGDTEYRRAKIGQEAAIRSYDIDVTLLRPTMVLGERSPDVQHLVERTRAGTFLLPAGGRCRVQPVHVDDVAAAAVSALRADASIRKAYILAGPEGGISYRDLVTNLRDLSGGRAALRSLPLLPMRLAAPLFGVVGLSRSIRAQIAFYGQDHLYSIEEAREQLGFAPRSYDDAIRASFPERIG